MAKKTSKKEEKKSILSVLWCKLAGVALMLFPLLVFASLADYDAADPSFNKVTTSSREIHNFLGLFGASVADAVLSSFGIALVIFLLVPIFWGYGLYRHNAFPEYKTRIFAWIVGLLSFSCFTDLVLSKYLVDLNLPKNIIGSWSKVISRPLNDHVNLWASSYDTIILACTIFFVSLISFNFSAGISFKRWFGFFGILWYGLCALVQMFVRLCKKIINIGKFREFKEINPRYLQDKTRKVLNISLRREPSLSRVEPTMHQSLSNSTTLSNTNSYSAYNEMVEMPTAAVGSGLTIEIPSSMSSDTMSVANMDSQTMRANSFNPTFDFMDEQEAANQNVKKQSRRASAKQTLSARQEELLEVPSKAPKKELSGKPMEQKSVSESRTAMPSVDGYMLPDIDLLSAPEEKTALVVDENALKQRALQLEHVLNDFNIQGKIVKVSPGPVVTLYELEPKSGTRTARVIGLSDDIARSMAVGSVRMAVVSGKSTIGIELPNEKRQTVGLRELLEDGKFTESKNILTVALGKDIGGQHVYADLAGMPHLLVAGTTGSGKSVGVNSMILSLLYRLRPEQCKFIMIDPKCVEFSMYNGIPHLLTPVITDPAKAVVGLKWAVQEMENRNRSLALLNVRNIVGYNRKMEDMSKSGKEIKRTIQTGFDKETGLPVYEEQVVDTTPMPYIVIVVDEMADLMLVAGKEVEAAIQRLAQMGRAVGIHLIMATQRPSVDVITGVIKANFPSRISFHVTNKFDSTTIIGEKGAEQLLGRGDMLFVESGSKPRRVHGCFVPDDEVEKVVDFIKEQGEPQYVAEVTAGELDTKNGVPVFDGGEMAEGGSDEDLYRQAVEVVRNDKKASISYVQRKLRIGYNRAANLIERMEREGVVTKQDHVGRREVIGVD
jgi:S-DNA-T family DNA segregation ATPase FtsK/SpoIIIE